MDDWQEIKLNDLVSKLGDGLHGTPKYSDSGDYLFINGSNLLNGRIITDQKTKRVSKDEFEKYKKELSDRTIFLSINGTIGNVGTYNGEKIILGKSACYFNVKDSVSKDFVKYIVTGPDFQKYIVDYATGTTIKNVPLKAIREYPVKIPSLPTQKAIAEILSSLDDKIELNNQINQNLEALAQALFKQWFVDFEFPNENGEPYKSSGGEMVDSELGEIPKGWRAYFLNELVECFDNKRVPLSSMERNLRKGEFPYYGAASLMDYIDDYLFDGDYVLMGEDGSVTTTEGFPVLQYVSGKFWVNNHAHVLKGKAISTELIHCLLRKTNITHLVTGAVQPKLNQGNMNKIFMFLPSNLSEIELFEDTIQSFYSQIKENKVENDHLIKLRDTLLPKLISGELEVNESLLEQTF